MQTRCFPLAFVAALIVCAELAATLPLFNNLQDIAISSDVSVGRCGRDFGHARCADNGCCSIWGYCGTSEQFCGRSCQREFGRCSDPFGLPQTGELNTSIEEERNLFKQADKHAAPQTGCGNGICEVSGFSHTETCGNCPADCGPCQELSPVDSCVDAPNSIALTFDDGPNEDATTELLAILRRRHVKATFFNLGQQIDQFPNLLAQQIEDGHSALFHSYTHVDFSKIPTYKIAEELILSDVAHLRAGVCTRPTLFRPPLGNLPSQVGRELIRNMGQRIVKWTIDSDDWKLAEEQPEVLLERFMSQLNSSRLSTSGVISLHHALFQYTISVIDELLDEIERSGFQVISLEECVWGRNYTTHPARVRMYRSCDSSVAAWPERSAHNTCPISDWSTWSPCDATCGKGVQTRIRLPMPPSLADSEEACGGVKMIEKRSCLSLKQCTGCRFSEWSEWSSCSHKKWGTRSRQRSILPGSDLPVCKHGLVETDVC